MTFSHVHAPFRTLVLRLAKFGTTVMLCVGPLVGDQHLDRLELVASFANLERKLVFFALLGLKLFVLTHLWLKPVCPNRLVFAFILALALLVMHVHIELGQPLGPPLFMAISAAVAIMLEPWSVKEKA